MLLSGLELISNFESFVMGEQPVSLISYKIKTVCEVSIGELLGKKINLGGDILCHPLATWVEHGNNIEQKNIVY